MPDDPKGSNIRLFLFVNDISWEKPRYYIGVNTVVASINILQSFLSCRMK